MIDGLDVEIWGQRARRVKAVLVTDDNRNAVLLWMGFTQDEIDNALGGIPHDLETGDAIVLTDGGNIEDDEGNIVPKPGQFTRVVAASVDYLYRRPVAYPEVILEDGTVNQHPWYTGLDACNDSDEALDTYHAAEIFGG